MTRQEFIKRQRTMTREVNRRAPFLMAFFVIGLVGCFGVSGYLEEREVDWPWLGNIIGAGLLMFGLLVLAAFVLVGLRQQKRFGHRCPHCNANLIGGLAQVAIATGNCGTCGDKVFVDSGTPKGIA